MDGLLRLYRVPTEIRVHIGTSLQSFRAVLRENIEGRGTTRLVHLSSTKRMSVFRESLVAIRDEFSVFRFSCQDARARGCGRFFSLSESSSGLAMSSPLIL